MFHLSIFVKIGLCLILNICLWFGKNQKENKMNDKNKERITIEISAELKKKVVVYCAENGIKSVKEFITMLIESALKN